MVFLHLYRPISSNIVGEDASSLRFPIWESNVASISQGCSLPHEPRPSYGLASFFPHTDTTHNPAEPDPLSHWERWSYPHLPPALPKHPSCVQGAVHLTVRHREEKAKADHLLIWQSD